MFESMDIGLKASIISFMKKFGIDETSTEESKIFEDFANYVVISDVIRGEYQVFNNVSTGYSRGIDGIAIIVNGRVMNEPQDLERLGDDEKLKVEIIFIQSTLRSSFESQKFSSFVDSAISFLSGNLKIEPFSEIVKQQYLFERRGFYSSPKTKKLIESIISHRM